MIKNKILLCMTFLIVLPFVKYSEILFEVSGRLEYQGKGIGGIQIIIYDITSDKTNKGSYSTTTKDSGRFSIFLDPGEYSFQLERHHPVYYMADKYSEKVTIKEKDISGILIKLEKICSISGYIRFNDGTPVKVDIWMDRRHSRWYDEKIDETGNFMITGVRAGEQILVIDPEEMFDRKIFKFILVPGENKKIDIEFPKIISINGRVFGGERTRSLDNVRLQLFSYNDDDEISGGAVLEINPDGEFIAYNLKPGIYTLQARSSGIGLSPIRKFNLGENEIKQIDIQLE